MGQELTIGRGYSNLLRLEGDEISRVHAIIYRRNNDFIVRDLDSKNGIFVNGSKVACAHLGPGDRLQVGKYKMIFNPPTDFEVNGDGEAGAKNAGNGNVIIATPAPAFEDPAEFTSSGHVQHIKEPPPPPLVRVAVKDPSPAPFKALREEVFLLTRAEVERQMEEVDPATRDQMVDFHDAFFEQLLKRTVKSASAFVDVVLHALVRALAADRGVIVLAEGKAGDLRPAAIVAPETDVAVNRVVLRSGLTEGKAILCPRTEDSGLFRENETVVRDRISSLISVPLGSGEPFGLLYVDRIGEADELDMAHFMVAAKVARLLELHLLGIRGVAASKDGSL